LYCTGSFDDVFCIVVQAFLATVSVLFFQNLWRLFLYCSCCFDDSFYIVILTVSVFSQRLWRQQKPSSKPPEIQQINSHQSHRNNNIETNTKATGKITNNLPPKSPDQQYRNGHQSHWHNYTETVTRAAGTTQLWQRFLCCFSSGFYDSFCIVVPAALATVPVLFRQLW
jgi:hypothetical protein